MRRLVRPFLFSLLNALAMLALALFWLSLPRTFGDESFFIKWTSLVKKTLLGMDPKPDASEFLYVDVSQTKGLLPVNDPLLEEPTGFNHIAITDRAALTQFLELVRQYGEDVPLVILDVFLEQTTPDDPLLEGVVSEFPFPLVGATDRTFGSAVPLWRGVALYLSTDNTFMKYPLHYADSLPTLPLVAYLAASQTNYAPRGYGVQLARGRSFTNPIIDFRVRPFDFEPGGPYQIFDLGSLLFQWSFWEETDIRDMLRGRTLVVGDFKNDLHQTIFGTVPGPMIVHNAYLTIAAGDTLLRWEWLLLLGALFFWMSWRVYREEEAGTVSWLASRFQTSFGKVVADSVDDTFFLAIGTILSYLIFNIHINILILLVYLKCVAWLLRRFGFGKKARL